MTDPHPVPPAPPPDPAAAPESMVVTMDTGERIHELDWGAPAAPPVPALPPLVLIHGIAQTAWSWAPVARRLAGLARVVAIDLRGHGLSDAPRTGYDPSSLAYDVLTVVSANGWGADVGGPRVVVAGHGAGGMIAATAAALAPRTVAGTALLDGGWESQSDATGMNPAELLGALAEPPEVLRTMDAWLADRRGYDPSTWDDDQETAARAQVDQKYAGHVALRARTPALKALLEGLDAYRPDEALGNVLGPLLVAIAESGGADDDTARERALALDEVERLRRANGGDPTRVVRFPGVGHNLMRYRPDAVAAELLALLRRAAAP
ncbi:MAG: alpha/beta hydrolase [Chloroflexota bacterium]